MCRAGVGGGAGVSWKRDFAASSASPKFTLGSPLPSSHLARHSRRVRRLSLPSSPPRPSLISHLPPALPLLLLFSPLHFTLLQCINSRGTLTSHLHYQAASCPLPPLVPSPYFSSSFTCHHPLLRCSAAPAALRSFVSSFFFSCNSFLNGRISSSNIFSLKASALQALSFFHHSSMIMLIKETLCTLAP